MVKNKIIDDKEMGMCISKLKKGIGKGKKYTRRRLSISTTADTPNENDEIKRSILELKENEDRFKESSCIDVPEKTISGKISTKESEKKGFLKRTVNKRSSVAGVRASHFQEDFEKKCVKIVGSVENLNQNGIGYVCRKGLKPESPNQDDFIIITTDNLALYAIFDGHGPYGHEVSNYVQKVLPYMIIENENFLNNPKEVFTKAFLDIHHTIEVSTNNYLDSFLNKSKEDRSDGDNKCPLELQNKIYENDEDNENDESDNEDNENESHNNEGDDSDDKNSIDLINDNTNIENKHLKKKKKNKKKYNAFFDSTMSGTTATIIVHLFNEKKLYVAYVGDSRAVLGKRKHDESGKLKAVELTKDHKPNSSEEKKRIINSGGEVMKLEGDIPYRVFIKNKFYPGLAMSRAIGDTIGHQIGVISNPDFIELDINEEEDVLILVCSDGVWEFITSEEAINFVYEFGYDEVQEAVENLAKEAWDRWLNEEENIVDDITIEAIYLSNDKNKTK